MGRRYGDSVFQEGAEGRREERKKRAGLHCRYWRTISNAEIPRARGSRIGSRVRVDAKKIREGTTKEENPRVRATTSRGSDFLNPRVYLQAMRKPGTRKMMKYEARKERMFARIMEPFFYGCL